MKLLYTLNPDITFMDNALWKSVLTTIGYLIIAYMKGIQLFDMKMRTAMFLGGRLFFGDLSMFLITYSVNYVSMSTATLIINMSPFYVAVFGYLLLHESISKLEVILMFIGFGGIYLVCINRSNDDNKDQLIGVFLFIIVSMTVALSGVCLRRVNKVLHPLHSPVFFAISTLTVCLVIMFFQPKLIPKVHTYTYFQMFLLFLGSQIGMISQFFRSSAHGYEKASRLAPYIYLQVVFGIIADLFVFHFKFTLLETLGIAIVSVCLLIPAFMKYYGYVK